MNIQAAKDLVQLYRSITKEDINEDHIDEEAGRLTGFGSEWTCSLCLAAKKEMDKSGLYCQCCIHWIKGSKRKRYREISYHFCLRGESRKTMLRLSKADTILKLLNAFKARADYIEGVIARLEGVNQSQSPLNDKMVSESI